MKLSFCNLAPSQRTRKAPIAWSIATEGRKQYGSNTSFRHPDETKHRLVPSMWLCSEVDSFPPPPHKPTPSRACGHPVLVVGNACSSSAGHNQRIYSHWTHSIRQAEGFLSYAHSSHIEKAAAVTGPLKRTPFSSRKRWFPQTPVLTANFPCCYGMFWKMHTPEERNPPNDNISKNFVVCFKIHFPTNHRHRHHRNHCCHWERPPHWNWPPWRD